MKCFSALAFLLLEDVVEGFETLTEDVDVQDEFLVYFEHTYISAQRGRGSNRRRVDAIFPPRLWNVHERTLTGHPCTNNAAEGFNCAFRQSLTNTHPNLWMLIVAPKKEESLTQTKIVHFKRGDSLSRKKKYKTINERLNNLVQRYKKDDMIDFLRNVTHNLH